MRKKISFVLAIYNAERTLKECLDSIFMQKIPERDYEVIIVDGGSKDRTLEIIKDFKRQYKNVKLIHNKFKLSEGKGMGKSQGIENSNGKFIVLLDHDNILIGENWIRKMMYPFEKDNKIMAVQSRLGYKEEDSNFLKYINAAGVEDSFAIPYSLVAQVELHPEKFPLIDNEYYEYVPDKKNVLFGGANGCIFRREVFEKIGGYTRDVNISASMAKFKMEWAVAKNARVYHKTSSDFLSFLRKKITYFYRFIDYGYKEENFQWVPKGMSGRIKFYLMIAGNLIFLPALFTGIKQIIKTKRAFWLLHPFYVYYMTLTYGVITLLKFENYFKYIKKINS